MFGLLFSILSDNFAGKNGQTATIKFQLFIHKYVRCCDRIRENWLAKVHNEFYPTSIHWRQNGMNDSKEKHRYRLTPTQTLNFSYFFRNISYNPIPILVSICLDAPFVNGQASSEAPNSTRKDWGERTVWSSVYYFERDQSIRWSEIVLESIVTLLLPENFWLNFSFRNISFRQNISETRRDQHEDHYRISPDRILPYENS